MASYPLNPYNEIDTVGLIPDNAANRWLPIALTDGIGTYEFSSLAIVRTLGAAAASVAPILATTNPSTGETIFYRALTTGFAAFPPGSFFSLPEAVRFFVAPSINVFVAIEPNVFGDTFAARLRVRRVF